MKVEIKSLTSIRGIACLLVVFGHINFYLDPKSTFNTSSIGVMLFFTLSGFLLAYLYADLPNAVALKKYACRRFMRIYPVYAASCLLIWAFFTLFPDYQYTMFVGYLDIFKLLTFQVDPLILWTVRAEILFYLIFPFMAALISVSTKQFPKWSYIVVLLILLSLLHSVSSYEFNERTQVLPRLLHTFFRGDEFFITGMLAGYTYSIYGDTVKRYKKTLTLCSIIFTVGFIISFPFVLEQILGTLPNHYLDFRVYEYALPLSLLMSGLLLCVALTDSTWVPVLHNKALLLIGKISFGIYLVHDFFLRIFMQIHVFPVSIGICITLVLCLTLAVSYALHILVEKPSISYARKIK